jgi:hypothetical protein
VEGKERRIPGTRKGGGVENGWNEEVGWRTKWRGGGDGDPHYRGLSKIKPTDPLRLKKQTPWRNRNTRNNPTVRGSQ